MGIILGLGIFGILYGIAGILGFQVINKNIEITIGLKTISIVVECHGL